MNLKSVRDAMTPSPQTIEGSASLDAAKKLLYTLGIRHLPVTEHGKLIGIVSDRDIKLATAVEGHNADRRTVKEVCVGEVFTVSPDESLATVARQMSDRGLGSAVIVDGEKVVGIFTTTDACKVLAAILTT